MCLVLKYLEPKIADEDIVCYKLVERTKIKGVYKSSFQGFEYIIRRLYTNNLDIRFVDKIIKRWTPMNPYSYIIEEGMFHSYINNPYSIFKPLPSEFVLIKCVIPKGAYYFIGVYCSLICYASSQIKILEEI